LGAGAWISAARQSFGWIQETLREPSRRIAVVRRVTIHSDDAKEAPAVMYSVFYIIGVVVVVLAILSLLGLA
jgi:small-conductance mechanosensitive channel